MNPRRIALVGTASSGAGAPYADPSFEIWGVSMRAPYVTRAARWFELHRLDGEPPAWAASWRATMKGFTADIPEVLMFWPEPSLAPNVVAYPYNRIAERFGTYFMTSTFSWMMALAIDEMRPLGPDGFAPAFANGDEVSIFGIDMELGTEYRCQRQGFRHFIEVAKSLGITVTRDVASGLIYEPAPYPFWQDDPQINKLERRNGDVKAGIRRLNKSLDTTQMLTERNMAILNEMRLFEAPGYDIAARRAFVEREQSGLKDIAAQAGRDLIAHEAVSAEQLWYLDYLRS